MEDAGTNDVAKEDPVLACMAQHRSVRRFRDAPAPEADIGKAVRAAQMAATSSWVQAYRLIQITEPEKRAQIAQLGGDQTQIHQAAAFFVVCADNRRHRLLMERAGKSFEHNFEVFLTSVIDASLFAQNLTLAFESMGYGTCCIGELRTDVPGVCAALELPIGVFPLFGLCVGRPAEDPGQRPRLDLESVWVKDRVPTDAEILAEVDRADASAQAYYASRGAPKRNWSGAMLRRFSIIKRQNLAGAYRAQGARVADPSDRTD